MLFNSWEFIAFFVITTVLYYLLSHRFRWALVLLMSCLFYMAFVPKFILILCYLIVVDYAAGILIERSRGRMRDTVFVLSLCSNIGVLFFFKYFNFFSENIQFLAQALHWNYSLSSLQIILPIGLSFHTFQSMSYTIEVYRGEQKAERHFGIFALYVMFYPQLVAGPIERPQNLLPQLHREQSLNFRSITNGLKLMFVGFFKKILIADQIAPFVDKIFGSPGTYHGILPTLAAFLFAIQLYCDFSGYSDIALGSAEVMGIKMMQNFQRPYLASSFSDFWKRWHISLTTWFNDYVFIPLVRTRFGGMGMSTPRLYLCIITVFLISGLWHGAGWNFVLWGALNGLFIVLNDVWRKTFKGSRKNFASHLAGIILTNCLWTFSLIFFRAGSLRDAWTIVASLFKGGRESWSLAYLWTATTPFAMTWSLSLIALIFVAQSLEAKVGSLWNQIDRRPPWLRWTLYWVGIGLFIWGGLNLGQDFKAQRFIYFQF